MYHATLLHPVTNKSKSYLSIQLEIHILTMEDFWIWTKFNKQSLIISDQDIFQKIFVQQAENLWERQGEIIWMKF